MRLARFCSRFEPKLGRSLVLALPQQVESLHQFDAIGHIDIFSKDLALAGLEISGETVAVAAGDALDETVFIEGENEARHLRGGDHILIAGRRRRRREAACGT